MFNRDQWIESYEGQFSLLRPHLSPRMLGNFSLTAWHRDGAKGIDPVKAAKAESAQMDVEAKKPKSESSR